MSPRVVNDYAAELAQLETAIADKRRAAVARGLLPAAELEQALAEIGELMKRAKALRAEIERR